jgi:hypothetical protein
MKKTMTLALAASILTLALAANPHTASAVGRMHKIVEGVELRHHRPHRRRQLNKRLSWASSATSTRWCSFRVSAAIYCPASGAGFRCCAFSFSTSS